MLEITRKNLQFPLSDEDSFSLKILADRYLLKDLTSKVERDDAVIVEFTSGEASSGGFYTIREVAIVNRVLPTFLSVTLFTGPERGKTIEVKPSQVTKLRERSKKELQQRIAKALARGDEKLEKQLEELACERIYFGGRILAGAGTHQEDSSELTLFNCYMSPAMKDSRGGIARHRELVMEIMSRGGGVGTNGSTLRPKGSKVHGVNGTSSGAVSWLDDLSQLTFKVQQGGSRRGAQMICLADWHPDLLDFITAKVQKPMEYEMEINGEKKLLKFGYRGNKTLEGANISILISDEFMRAVKNDELWELVFPDVDNFTAEQMADYSATWDWYYSTQVKNPQEFYKLTKLPFRVHYTIPARQIAELIALCMHSSAEPGVIFIDRCNRMSNSWYFNKLIGTNPCFTGDTKLLTAGGYKTFEELEGKQVELINKDGIVTTGKVWCSGEKEVVELKLSNKKSIKCTPDHVFMTIEGEAVEAKNLKGKRLMPYLSELETAPTVRSIKPAGVAKVYDFSEPTTNWGVVEGVIAHNCGEQPLPAWGVCNLGHINLAHPNHLKWIPELKVYRADLTAIAESVEVAVRALDNVIDVTPYHFEDNRKNQLSERRIGLGTMGIDELLKLEGLDYGTPEGRERAEEIFKLIALKAYETSIELATEKGSFPSFRESFLASGFMQQMITEFPWLKNQIETYGIRNVTLLTQAPTGTVGTLAQTSTGIEPFFASEFYRSSRLGVTKQVAPVIKRMKAVGMDTDKLKFAQGYTPKQHLDFQAVAQKWNDTSISKTINAPRGTTVEEVKELLEYAYEVGLKGFTIYVDGSRETQILTLKEEPDKPTQGYAYKNLFSEGKVYLTHKGDTLNGVTIELDKIKTDKKDQLINSLSHAIEVAWQARNSENCSCGAALVYVEGCFKCEACGFSKCG